MKKIITLLRFCIFSFFLFFSFSCSNSQKTAVTKNLSWEPMTILPVKNIPLDFIMGVDISSLYSVETSGAKFYNANAVLADPIELLKAGGANTARIRVWNNPNTEDGRSYGGGCNNIDVACHLGRRATKAGMGVLIDFHYSDFWADPNKQSAPKKWKKCSVEEKKQLIFDWTTECLVKLKKSGVKVTMVQIGNEINNGFCGEIYDKDVFSLVKSGVKAVRSFDEKIQIVIHYTDPLVEGNLDNKASLLEKYKVDYDIFGTSYYPFWHGDVKELSVVLRKISNFYNKKVMVMEVSYPWTDLDGDGYGNVVSTQSVNQEFNYPISVEGQAIAIRDVIEAVAKVKGAGLGVFYWEPAWIPVRHFDISKYGPEKTLLYNQRCWEKYGCGWATYNAGEYDKEVKSIINGGTWDNQSFFDFEGKVLDSINVWNYARDGSKGELKVVRIETPKIEFTKGKKNNLPAKVKVTYNDGSIVNEIVEWDKLSAKKLLNEKEFGEYKVVGKIKTGDDVLCIVNVTASNFLVNGNFEKGNLDGWVLENKIGKGNPKVDRNSQNSKEGLFYATGWERDNFDWTISQELKELNKGIYKCFAYFEGTGIKNPSDTSLVVEIKKKNGKVISYKTDVTIPNQWKKFDKVEISKIVVDDSVNSIVVKIRMKAEYANDGANGAWLVCDDVNFLLVSESE